MKRSFSFVHPPQPDMELELPFARRTGRGMRLTVIPNSSTIPHPFVPLSQTGWLSRVDANSRTKARLMRRWLGIAAGIVVQILFAVTSYYNYVFLQGTPPHPGHNALAWDAFLAIQFGVVHSLLLWPGVRQWLGRFIAPAFYGLFFCTAACLTLLLTMSQWQVGDWAVWQLTGWPRLTVQCLYLGCWGTLFYSLCCSGFGYHTGWLPWWYWVRRKPIPRRPFNPRGAFSIIRHPGYMSFLGLTWLTPDMTIDRAVLVAIWTSYIFLGSRLKDFRLQHYLGNTYEEYRARVPAYLRLVRISDLRRPLRTWTKLAMFVIRRSAEGWRLAGRLMPTR